MAAATSVKKTSKGRQKIAIKPIKNEEARQVCFSKRRAGVFKKANELSILCDAEVAVLVFSPAGKPFSFGHPSVDSILSRFLSADPPPPRPAPPAEAVPSVVPMLDQRYRELAARLEAARRRKEALEAEDLRRRRRRRQRQQQGGSSLADLLSSGVEALGLPELERLERALEYLRFEAASRAEQLQRDSAVAAHASAAAAGFNGSFFTVTAAAARNVALPVPQTGFGYGIPYGCGGFSN